MLLYEMIAGKPPFAADSTSETVANLIHKEPPPLKNVPDQLQRIICKTLRKNKNERYQTVKELLGDFEKFS
ncbi:MAG: hypothetical protein HC846_13645 [Blastocatellia bacterium]|nr:hypothetical protein [Blastocatellia bacterium]